MRIAVIPARGGSKRIPRKNIRPFCGRPIIAYTIDAARESRLFDVVMVSTDDREIADVAIGLGAEVPFVRPPTLADDHTGTNTVVSHAVQWFRDRGQRVAHACCLYATAPMIEATYIRQGYETLLSSGKSFAFSVTSFPYPIQRGLRVGEDGLVRPFNPEHAMTRSQDLEHAYHDAAQFYWGTAEAFIEDVPLLLSPAVGVILPRHLVQDIDTPEDWERAELMFRAYRGAGAAP